MNLGPLHPKPPVKEYMLPMHRKVNGVRQKILCPFLCNIPEDCHIVDDYGAFSMHISFFDATAVVFKVTSQGAKEKEFWESLSLEDFYYRFYSSLHRGNCLCILKNGEFTPLVFEDKRISRNEALLLGWYHLPRWERLKLVFSPKSEDAHIVMALDGYHSGVNI